mgnify:CR=1 FL=1
MLRAMTIAVAALVLLAVADSSQAQVISRNGIIYGGYGINSPTYYYPGYSYGSNYGSYYGNPYYDGPYLPRYSPGYYNPYPVYSAPLVPSATGNAFSGQRSNGNYWYWLPQQANEGRIPPSGVNRRLHGRYRRGRPSEIA